MFSSFVIVNSVTKVFKTKQQNSETVSAKKESTQETRTPSLIKKKTLLYQNYYNLHLQWQPDKSPINICVALQFSFPQYHFGIVPMGTFCKKEEIVWLSQKSNLDIQLKLICIAAG